MPQAIGALEFISILFGNNRTQGLIYFSSLPNARNDPNEKGERRLLTQRSRAARKIHCQARSRRPRAIFLRWHGRGPAIEGYRPGTSWGMG